MNTYIALFRGINVGGNNILPMKELVVVLEGLGLSNVRTYIQSGNAVFRCEKTESGKLGGIITAAIEKSHGFSPQVLILSVQELEQVISNNPFPDGEIEPKTLHLFFLKSVPDEPDIDLLESLRAEGEHFRLMDGVFYLHARNGIGRSKVATKVERALGVPVTARNWRSVNKVMSMAAEVAAQ